MPTSIPANYEEKTTNQGPSNSPQIATNSPQIAVQFHKKINIAATMEEDKKTKEAPTPPWRIIVKPLHPHEPPPPPSGEANAKPKLIGKTAHLVRGALALAVGSNSIVSGTVRLLAQRQKAQLLNGFSVGTFRSLASTTCIKGGCSGCAKNTFALRQMISKMMCGRC